MKKFLVSVAAAAIMCSGTAYARDYSLGANTNFNPQSGVHAPAPGACPDAFTLGISCARPVGAAA
jgi:hypothetical protein